MNSPRPIERRGPATEHGSAGLVARLYAARGATAQADFELPLAALEPVGSLGNIDAAVELLATHLNGRILVVGDFDADGATSVALVLRCLAEFGASNCDYLVPNRFEFGYGLTPELADIVIEREPTLVVTVDNGISSHDGIAAVRAAGIDVLVTDHHLPPDELPAASVIVNPNLRDDDFASKALAGVGVAFYLMAALGRAVAAGGRTGAERIAARYLDLVALGTVADVVPLDRNNRILVSAGLDRIRAGRAVPGILALLADGGRDYRRTVAQDLGFVAGPRLNAAGRMHDMSHGIEALLSDDPAAARRQATALGDINRQRRETETDMQRDAVEQLARIEDATADSMPACISLYDPGWHQGVVGLIASRIRERSQRPVFAFAGSGDGELKGSGRSIPGVHLRDLLAFLDSREPSLMGRFGGHAMAAGLTLPLANYAEFRERIAAAAADLYPNADFSGAWITDGELDPGDFCLDVANCLRDAGPWGQGFEEPLFDGRFRVVRHRIVGEKHLRLTLQMPSGANTIEAIAFRQADVAPLASGALVQLVYRLDVNDYRGILSPQLVVEQIEVVARGAD